jgi:chromosome segregation ATPase
MTINISNCTVSIIKDREISVSGESNKEIESKQKETIKRLTEQVEQLKIENEGIKNTAEESLKILESENNTLLNKYKSLQEDYKKLLEALLEKEKALKDTGNKLEEKKKRILDLSAEVEYLKMKLKGLKEENDKKSERLLEIERKNKEDLKEQEKSKEQKKELVEQKKDSCEVKVVEQEEVKPQPLKKTRRTKKVVLIEEIESLSHKIGKDEIWAKYNKLNLQKMTSLRLEEVKRELEKIIHDIEVEQVEEVVDPKELSEITSSVKEELKGVVTDIVINHKNRDLKPYFRKDDIQFLTRVIKEHDINDKYKKDYIKLLKGEYDSDKFFVDFILNYMRLIGRSRTVRLINEGLGINPQLLNKDRVAQVKVGLVLLLAITIIEEKEKIPF